MISPGCRKISWVIGSFFLLLLSSSCRQPEGPGQTGEGMVVIRDVSVIDVVGENTLSGVDIAIDSQTIADVGSGIAAEYPDARVIDGAGAFVIPALTDSHVHVDTTARVELMLPEASGLEFAIEELEEDLGVYPLFGITTVVVLDGSPEQLELKARANRANWTMPRVVLATPILDGQESGNPLHTKVASPEEANQRLSEYLGESYDLVKVYTFLDGPTYLSVLERCAELGIPVWGHLPKDLPLEEALDPRLTNVAHAEELTRSWDGEDPLFAARVADLLIERGISLTPNLVAYDEIIAEVEDLDAHLATKDWGMVNPLARIYSLVPYNGYVEDFGGEDIRDRVLGYFRRQHAEMFEIVRLMAERGGTLLAGSDAGNPTMYPGDGLHRELELLVAAGLNPYRALAAATVTPSIVLGESDQRGRIEPGELAELVLLESDPIQDIKNTRDITGLYSRGEYVDRSMLAARRDRLTSSFEIREARYREHLPAK